jgi:heme-degrading monooxygenase HmoA
VGAAEARVTVVSLLRLPVRPGAEDELVQAFAELRIFERSNESGGFLGGRLLRPVGDAPGVVVVAEWESPADYQGWLDNPVRDELGRRLEPLLAGDVEAGELFEEC